MKFELARPCQQCDARDPVNVPIMATWWEWRCPSCGHDNEILSSSDWTLGWRVLEKAKTEYIGEEDYSSSIVFSAMALDVELARMYFKWRRIDTMLTEQRMPSPEEFDDEYRRLGNVAERIDAVAWLLDPRGIDDFAKGTELAERIDGEAFPTLALGSLASDIQREVFWPRNRILHSAYFEYTAEDAKRVHDIASVGLDLLKRMDAARRVRGRNSLQGRLVALRDRDPPEHVRSSTRDRLDLQASAERGEAVGHVLQAHAEWCRLGVETAAVVHYREVELALPLA